ncbi:MAG: hypothetical protein IJH14_08825 [Solobacterium sp.]|nr:hypothetical protein [Solobacterium sp.]
MNKFDRFLEKAANRKRYSLRRILAGVVVFATTYALILPAITIETDVAEDDPGIVLNSDGQTETQNPAVILEKIIEDTSYKITAEAEEKILPAGSVLSAEIVKEEEKQKLLDRIHEQNLNMETDEEILSIKIMDDSENEVQPQGSMHFQIERELREDERTPQLLLIKETPTGEYETELLDTEEHQVVAVNTEKKQIIRFVTDRTGYFTAVYEKEETATEEIPPEVLTETETEEPEEIVSEEESEEPAETAEETEPVTEEAEDFVFFERVNGLDVNVRADHTAFPEGTTMTVYAVNDENIEETVANTVEGKVRKVAAVDITFLDAYDNEVQPSTPIQVMITPSEAPKQAEAVSVVHVDNEGNGEKIEDIETTENTIAFEAEQFSVYAVVYTVDFSYEVDGKSFTFSMEGGSTMSFKDLVIALGIETEEDIDSFMEEVKDVVFSDPSLIRIKKNEKFLFFGEKDWIMESLEPFRTKETLTITMKDGQVFAVQVTDEQLYVNVITADGSGYLITVTYKSDAGIPEDAELEASEIIDPAEYETYLNRTAETLGQETDALSYARFFDIKIVKDNETIQPKEGSVVGVSIELNDAAGENLSVVHFGEEPEVLASTTEENSVVFETTGFSVYGIVDAPEPAKVEIQTVMGTEELVDNEPFYLSYNGLKNYTTNDLNGNSAFIETNKSEDADEWYFESADDGSFYIYTMEDGNKQYMYNQSGNLVSLSNTNKTAFEISQAAEGKFYLKKAGEDKWLQHSNGGKGIRFYTDNNNATNSRITITYADSYRVQDDPYELNGKTYGIAFHNDTAAAAAMMADTVTVGSTNELRAVDMLMRPDVLDNEGILLVAEGSDIQEWTFESITEDYYYLKTTVNGATKYLTVNGKNITLSDEPDPENHSVIKAVPGTGASSGKWHFTVNGYNVSADLSGTSARGFAGANNNGTSTWLNLVERSVLNDDDFTLYTAQKVSVSDTVNVHDGQQVVIYTRIWNEEKKKYEFFAVDHDGSLVRCYDTGDNIEWIGSNVNTALWTFTEYTNPDGTLNYFYDLQNTQYGNYIDPQVSDQDIFSNDPVGINMGGRRYGENYTSIIAWDDNQYAYSGLKTENGKVVACPLSEAEDFYFAVINPVDPQDELSTVDTIDNNEYGITMKMMDFNNELDQGRDKEQRAFLGGDEKISGLLSTNLGDDGYPIGTDKAGESGQGTSLSVLFNEKSAGSQTVNHLLIESIYNESGYFEYDSTQNYAHLNDDGTFTVYDQLGAISGNNPTQNTRNHGQFMPYDKIESGKYATYRDGNIVTNQTDVLANPLPDTDPRKGEKLYDLGHMNDVDYFFGMEMEANFTQTASGLDAWGHDIIFEFSGDDDFWLYVDGELVLDLGGVHSAEVGSVNFRTGVITSSRDNPTSLYETFKKNYQTRGMSDSEISTKLEEIFTLNDEGNYVFKDYTNHTMKMFYMERGAGASNLHMRFNLSAVKPGTFVLSKKLSGTEDPANSMIEFPYQIYYKAKDGTEQYHLLGENAGDQDLVKYKDTNRSVTYMEEYKPVEEREAYRHVFFLKPGESAVVDLPDNVEYYVKECYVDPTIYDVVKANNTVLTGTTSAANPDRKDYAVAKDTMENRPQVDYDNHVKEGAMREVAITKKLYDVDGQTELKYPQNDTLFRFRLYLGTENADEDNLPLANLYPYFVKDSEGHYCKWNVATQKFESLSYTEYDELKGYLDTLTSTEKEAIIFRTSMNGTISKIPAGYTVEVRDLIVGTKYKVEERADEIPRGYTLRLLDGYTRTDMTPEQTHGTTPISDVLEPEESPKIDVRNQKGWGLTVEKIWTDKDFMASHDPIYFAVYVKDDNDCLTLLDDSVRQMKAPDTSLYYFFGNLQSGIQFSRYIVREVTLDGDITVDAEGKVSRYTDVHPIDEGDTLTVGGTPVGGTHQVGYQYKVHYEPGKQTTHNENVRTDKVTNSRPGIELYKTDWEGTNLQGAVFTLKDSEGKDVAASTYTSDETGLITIAYLNAGTYTLQETEVPKGYTVLDDAMTITIGEDETVTVSGVDESMYTLTEYVSGDMKARITIKNRTVGFKAVKVDAITNDPMEGVHFALYNQVTDQQGQKRKDYQPITGYEDLVTDENGVLPKINMDELSAGTYYLTETQTQEGYELLGDICFTIGKDGTIVIDSGASSEWLSKTDDENGNVSYTLTVKNSMGKYELPSSGGPGTTIFTVIGLLLILTAGTLLVTRQKMIS